MRVPVAAEGWPFILPLAMAACIMGWMGWWAAAAVFGVAALACLGFFRDPDAGIAEMTRVTKPGGTVAACMWDIADGGMTMLRMFWAAVRTVRPHARGESAMPGTSGGDLVDRFHRAGMTSVWGEPIVVSAMYDDFDDFWEPFTYGIGPSGGFLVTLTEPEQAEVRAACRSELPDGPFSLSARAWYAQGIA